MLILGYYKAHPPDIASSGLTFNTDVTTFLGVQFSMHLKDTFELNFPSKLQKIKNILRTWSMRDLTPIGKIAVVKSLAISQLIYLLSVLPKPPDSFLKEVESVLFKFIWNGKPDKINRKTLIGDFVDGGLKMLHLPSIISGLKIAWVKRLLDENNSGQWKSFYEHYLAPFGGNLFWYGNINEDDVSISSIKNSFIREVAQAWASFTLNTEINRSQCRRQSLWNNTLIRVNHKVLFIKSWYDKCFFFFHFFPLPQDS